jgi:hypothetical protein
MRPSLTSNTPATGIEICLPFITMWSVRSLSTTLPVQAERWTSKVTGFWLLNIGPRNSRMASWPRMSPTGTLS